MSVRYLNLIAIISILWFCGLGGFLILIAIGAVVDSVIAWRIRIAQEKKIQEFVETIRKSESKDK